MNDDLVSSIRNNVGSRACLPLSPADFEQYEIYLGIRLPAILKELYTTVGNGGFGPSDGMLPLCASGEEGESINYFYARFHQSANGRYAWQAGVVPICHWGCLILSCIDVAAEEDDPIVLRYEPNMSAEDTKKYLRGSPFRGKGLFPECDRLSRWLRDWLGGVEQFQSPYARAGAQQE